MLEMFAEHSIDSKNEIKNSFYKIFILKMGLLANPL
jgi:hypothetical protein